MDPKLIGKEDWKIMNKIKCYICEPNDYKMMPGGILPICDKHSDTAEKTTLVSFAKEKEKYETIILGLQTVIEGQQIMIKALLENTKLSK